MDEREWLASEDPMAMLRTYVGIDGDDFKRRGVVTDRKLRLFAIACARLGGYAAAQMDSEAVEDAEAMADGTLAGDARPGFHAGANWAVLSDARDAARTWAEQMHGRPSRSERAALLREVAGNPFRRVIRPETMPGLSCAHWWIDSDVLSIAQRCYESRWWHDLPVLGDALEDAGCTNDNLLAHLRSAGPHVRGCWALDLILGKE